MPHALFRTKPLDTPHDGLEQEGQQLHRVLGPLQLTLLGIGAIIGAGIFATIGTAAAGDAVRPGAGPALMLSFVITAVACGFTALCYAEFAALVPNSGSAYTYAYTTLGEIVAWVIGWDLIIEYAVGNVAVAISWANYCKTLLAGLGILIPDWLSMDYRTAARLVGGAGVSPVYRAAPHVLGIPIVFNLPAVLIVTVITGILVWGIRESARFNAVMVGIKILVLAFFIVIGWSWVRPENWTPFAPNGWAGISAGAAIVFFAYIGFDAVSTVAEETKDPRRTLPVGILASLVICTIFYVAVAAVFTGLISYTDLKATLATEQAEPLTIALAHASPDLGWAVGIVAFGSVIAHTAVLLVFQLGQPRILFAMSRDGLLPPIFRAVHPRFRTPYVASLLTGAFVGTCAAFASIDEMVDLTNIGTLFAFILVCAGIVVLRIQDPTRPRPFRVPGGWGWATVLYLGAALALSFSPLSGTMKVLLLVLAAALFVLCRNHIFPVLGLISCVYLIYYLPPTSWLRFAAWLNCGLVVYALYGAENSRLAGKYQSGGLAADAVQRVRAGVWLAVVGAVVLLFTRGVDLWMEALRKTPGEAGVTKITTTLGAVLRPAPWLEPSWFLLLPLTLTSCVLCPVLIRRAMRVRAASVNTDSPQLIRESLLLSGILTAGGVAYVMIVFARLWGFL